jgi:hypothetical protein
MYLTISVKNYSSQKSFAIGRAYSLQSYTIGLVSIITVLLNEGEWYKIRTGWQDSNAKCSYAAITIQMFFLSVTEGHFEQNEVTLSFAQGWPNIIFITKPTLIIHTRMITHISFSNSSSICDPSFQYTTFRQFNDSPY